ncbi:hypothetical protein RJZ56_007502 [Blastomyces dermatitidis]|uniref:Uncharacterized protein n=2 Tax=Ajellomyces dermatitidis TaxID=5039 RepID=F2TII8_AJEDA|nr:uncharacterized protein BDCG_17611 [Blastomyces dermatitidis ER-3]EGE83051.1 hypothetical protein BDDG_05995 [Blastomyces dermatitidis ATCC 18188]EQL30391.1 hypothetical protein BDFG_07081 [Blastomyces dermatitidis ATCC 26199]OAT02524.1 hypothetical protein BDCG_17611 [Blastomyces dermatitidis ER-3]
MTNQGLIFTRATTASADATRNSPIWTSFLDEHKGARQGHVSSGNRGWNNQVYDEEIPETQAPCFQDSHDQAILRDASDNDSNFA